MNFQRTRAHLAGLIGLTGLLLSACGGGDSLLASNPNPNPGTPAVALQPLSGGTQYVGTAGFGDTVSIALDQPAAGQLTLRFVDSRFGLAGALSARYSTQPDGSLLATNFSAVAGSGVPAALSAALTGLSLRFQVEGGLLSGSLAQVPNLKAADGSLLQGHVAASNQGVADIAKLAGVYSFFKQATAYSARGVAQGTADSAYGQLKVQADGKLRLCLGQAYGDSCSGGQSGQIAAEADQKQFPGAFALTLDGQRIGRLMVGAQSSAATLFVDEYTSASDGSFRTGAWVLQSAAVPLAANALDGEWLCAQPELDAKGLATGRTQRNFVSIAGSLLQTDTIDTDVALTPNAAFSIGATPTLATGVNGLVTGQWSDSRALARVFLPVGKSTAYYAGTSGSARFSGQCRLLPAQTPITTYASAPSNGTGTLTITLGDARPTQPAIGYDQIFYKLARYNNTANASTQWKKEFDDYCEATGLTDGAKGASVIAGTSLLTSTSSFTCSTKTFDITALKSAVVGPKGVLYLTDGHHTFTSFWEAPNGGGAGVKIPVVMKGNFMDQNNASFWRGMRARKTAWLKTPDGRAITPADLPAQLGLSNGLKDDAYRSLLYFTRGIGYDQPATGTEFLEFYWAEWLQASPQNFKLSAYTLTDAASYLQAIQAASNLMLETPDATVIGSSGLNAVQMGKRTSFDNTTYTDLNTPVSATKPGKLAYALSWRAALAAK
ncbi:ParB/Srx family N-terminal domain-containing protein [Variovorax terrae]|uniref:ParB/Srx family N-terminal domain-containing protein n=1 Tax=Variovorax terrae TaxID=2923278 RepID=A0A9X1VWB6_9BURK|nr:ParB/Srx family N-terminal domain-containing protein [Variovorax terrae]MCJ0761813.1 ParB/Srx family N-terminal domain-containing protein [Variovorax terrae]